MRTVQPRPNIQHDINLDPDAVAGMVRGDGLVGVDDGRETPGEKGDFLKGAVVDGGAGEACHVGEAGRGPVVDDEEGEEGGAEGVQPPEGKSVAEEGEEQGERIEEYVGFAVFGRTGGG